ncbi:hypothetical protein J8273_4274 [Carpediemonas membranifera]|uniref:Uncharacterized protein n=1 Tax=Carpediemonas membranifera TaxID=201153 RepID=A0A8J6B747_9EUKA|nr:hypothetical protein J8273_4274 [Carpediemonas membranifera]|eukprot:KAG9394172.1 hypothetical protein J8273_4274 [Carpediemonas membranifera]
MSTGMMRFNDHLGASHPTISSAPSDTLATLNHWPVGSRAEGTILAPMNVVPLPVASKGILQRLLLSHRYVWPSVTQTIWSKSQKNPLTRSGNRSGVGVRHLSLLLCSGSKPERAILEETRPAKRSWRPLRKMIKISTERS